MRYRWIFIALILALSLSACGRGMVPPGPEVPDDPPSEEPQPPEPEKGPEDPAEAALQRELERMSLEAKVGQLFFVQVPAENAAEDVMTYHLGGYILFGRDTQNKTANDLIQTIYSYQTAAYYDTGIPLLIGVDEEGGTVVRVSSNPKLRSQKFSSPGWLWQRGNEGITAVEEETREKTILLKALGFNVNLNPVVDISEDPKDFIYGRTIGGNTQETVAYAGRVVEVQSRYRLGSVLKHFPGYGNNKDTHTGIAVDERTLETFQEQDLLPFQEGIRVGEIFPPMPAVLVSHTIVNCMDPDLPASLSSEVHRILREDLSFDGVVMTDDLSMGALSEYAKDGSVAVMALRAGNDLVVTADYRAQIPHVIQAVKSGELEEAVIDAACRRVLRWKVELGLLEVSESGTLEGTVLPRG